MGRPPTFDRDEALDEAVQIFWEKGYEGASLEDLETAMGIGRASLYNAFGSKHALFTEAMARYAERAGRELLAPLREDGPARDVLAGFFEHVLAMRESGSPCCLAVRAAVTTAQLDPQTAAWVERFTADLEEALYRVVKRGRDGGELSSDLKPRALARFLISTCHGLSVSASIHRDRKVLGDITRSALSILD